MRAVCALLSFSGLGCRSDEAMDQTPADGTPEQQKKKKKNERRPSEPRGIPVRTDQPGQVEAGVGETQAHIEAWSQRVPEPGANVAAWHELSLGSERIEVFEDFVASAAVTSCTECPEIVKAEGTTFVSLRSDFMVSFSRFAKATQVEFQTNGYALTLVGSDFTGVRIMGNGSGINRRAVRLVTTGKSYPAIDLKGAAGQRGQDAKCPEPYESCLDDPPPAQSTKARTLDFVPRVETTNIDLASEWDGGRKVFELFEVMPRPEPQFESPEDECGQAQIEIKPGELQVRGQVSMKTSWLEPVPKGDDAGAGSDGFGIAGGDGEEGKPGGDLEILSLPGMPPPSHTWVQGGEGGVPGRSGLVGAGKGAAQETLLVNKTHVLWAVDPVVVWPRRVTWLGCRIGGGGGTGVFIPRWEPRSRDEAEPGALKRQVIEVEGTMPVVLPESKDGLEALRPVGRAGAKGRNGRLLHSVARTAVEYWEEVQGKAPLPRQVADELKGWVKGESLL